MPRISSLMSPGSALWFCRTAIDVIPALLRVWENNKDPEEATALIASINALRFAATAIANEQLDEHNIETGFEPVSISTAQGSSQQKLKLLAEAVAFLTEGKSND